MPRPRPPYLHKETTRHGKTVWYFRRSDRPRIRIYGQFGSPEFKAACDLALIGEKPARDPLPRSPRPQKPSYVYFAVSIDLVKIGVSTDPHKRLDDLQTANGARLKIVKTISGDRAVERMMHERFAHLHVRGEWFRRSDDLTAYLAGDEDAVAPPRREIIL